MMYGSPGSAKILNQTDSFESARLDSNSVVGYGAVGFYKN